MKNLFAHCFFILLSLTFAYQLEAQVKFRVGLLPDQVTYEVYLRPDTTWVAPFNSTVSSQLTLRVPTGGFNPTNLSSKKGNWTKSVQVVAPDEAPDYDYISFSLVAPTNDIAYQKNTEVLLFTFRNSGTCTGALVFIDNVNDPFLPPNSRNVNVGNLISVAGAGPGVNAFKGAYAVQGYDCLTVGSACGVTFNGFDYQQPSRCGVADGYIELYASTDLGLPLQYSINRGRNWQASNRFNNLAAGQYHIMVRDVAALCMEDAGPISLPGPLGAVVRSVPVTQPTCGASDGSITIDAIPNNNDRLQYSHDNGVNWQDSPTFNNLDDGTYVMKVRNLDNGCQNDAGTVVLRGCPVIPCLVYYELELLPDGRYQVVLHSDTTWGFPQNITSNMQVTFKAPTGSLQIGDFRNDLPSVVFAATGTFIAPAEDPASDYFTFGLQTTGTSNITYQKGLRLPLFSFTNEGTCSGDSLRLMQNSADPFFPPNSQNANVGQQLSVFGYGAADLPVCLNERRSVECITTPVRCLAEFELEQLPDGKFQVSMKPDTAFNGNSGRTTQLLLTVKVPTGGFNVGNLTSKIASVSFMVNGRYNSPNEAPDYDYINFELSNIGTDKIPYQKGQKTALFTFENSGSCAGQAIGLMDPTTDPFKMPNSESANVGLQLKISGYGTSTLPVCLVNLPNNDCGNLTVSRDTVYLTIPTDAITNYCIGNLLDLPNGVDAASVCQNGTNVIASMSLGSDCLNFQPTQDFQQTEIICVVHCDASIPGLCDTTVFYLCPELKFPPVAPICAGESVSLQTSGGAGTFTWTPADGLSCTDCRTPVATPAATTTYIVSAEESNICRQSRQITITVNPAPEPAFTFSGGCTNKTISFTNSTPDQAGITSWVWNFGDGNTSSATNPTHTYDDNGTYQVTLNATGIGGCTKESSVVTVIIDEVPAPAFAFTGNCAGQLISFSNTTTNPERVANWLWDFGDNSSSNEENPTHVFGAAGTYNVSLIGTTAGGCQSIVFETTVTIDPAPNAAFTYDNACSGQQSSFTNTTLNQGNVIDWLWDFGDGNTSSAVNPTHVFDNSGQFFVTLSATASNGCTNTSNPVSVQVERTPQPSFTHLGSCTGQDVEFANSTPNLGGVSRWRWNFGDNGTSGAANPDHNYRSAGTFTVSLIAETSGGCISAPFEASVVIEETPAAAFTVSGTCSGSPTTFSNTTSGSGDVTEWAWDFGDGNTSNTQNPIHTYAADGSYVVTLTSRTSLGCSSVATQSVLISQASTSGNAYQNSACENEDIQLIAQGGISWNWSPTTGLDNPTIHNPIANVNVSTTYTVEVLQLSGCARVDTFHIEVSNTPLIFDVMYDQPVSCDTLNGSIRIFATSGQDPVEYSIDCGQSWQSNSNFEWLENGRYCVQVRNTSTSCFSTWPITIELISPSTPVINAAQRTLPTGCGTNDASITVVMQDYQGMEYSIDGGNSWQSTNIFGNLSSGEYDLVVRRIGTDCVNDYLFNPIVIEEPLPPVVTTPLTDVYSCDAASKSITIRISENIDTFLITGGGGYVNALVQGNQLTFDAIPVAGINDYSVELKGVGGCIATETFRLHDIPSPELSATNTLDAICGETNGSFTLNLQHGKAPYTYDLFKEGILFRNDQVFNSQSQAVGSLAAGNYRVELIDLNGCTAQMEITIGSQDPSFGLRSRITKASCSGQDGSIEIINPGNGYDFEWRDVQGNVVSVDIVASGLGAGTYYLVVSDSRGCTEDYTFQLEAESGPQVVLEETINVLCAGEHTGAASFSIGGNGNYYVQIIGLGIIDTVAGGSNFLIENLAANTYELLIFNDLQCLTIRNFQITERTFAINDVLQQPTDCRSTDGSICLTLSGDNAPFVVRTAGVMVNVQQGGEFCVNNLNSAVYPVTITDSRGCIFERSYEIFAVNHPELRIEDVDLEDIICPTGQPSGAITSTTNIQYEVYDDKNSFIGTTPLNGLPAGSYRIVKEENGCEAEITATLVAPESWDVDFDVVDETCETNDGSITLLVSGANGTYTFDWSHGTASGSTASGLNSIDLYAVTITDANDCEYIVRDIRLGYDCPDCQPVFITGQYDEYLRDTFATICLPILDVELQNKQLVLDGQPYTGVAHNCSTERRFYDFNALLNLGSKPYKVESWKHGNQTFRNYTFNNLRELATRMNRRDPTGNWLVDEQNSRIYGGDPAITYGEFRVSHAASNTTLVLGVNNEILNRSSINVTGAGLHTLIVFDERGRCPDTLLINLIKEVEPPFNLIDTVYLTTFINTPIDRYCIDVEDLGNDVNSITMCNYPSNGTGQLAGQLCFDYLPGHDFTGLDSMCVEVCDGDNNCKKVFVYIDVYDEGLVIQTGISPNEDGKNDGFEIRGIELYPDNRVTIYNRWGLQVYHKTGYSNLDPWKGEYYGKQLPDGTYFFILEVREDGETKRYSGFIQLER